MIKFREGLRPPVPLDEVEDMYWDARPDYRVVEGEHTEGPFNRSAAINSAAKLAGNWDVADIVTRKMDPLYRQNLERWRRYEQVTCECGLRRVQGS
jgi:hypothetical protein